VAAKCSFQEITRSGVDELSVRDSGFLPEPSNSACLPSGQQASSVSNRTPDRKRGKSMCRRSGQAGTVVKKGKMWCGRYREDVFGSRPTQASVRASGTN
jgi:hypothetical protein